MRKVKAKEVADMAIVVCPLCDWHVPFSVGKKTDIRAGIIRHLRFEHKDEEA